MDELFEELRRLVARSTERLHLWEIEPLLEQAFETNEGRYREIWIPYLATCQKLPTRFCATSLEQIAWYNCVKICACHCGVRNLL